MPGMVSPTVTSMIPLGPFNAAVPSDTLSTVQFAIPFASMSGTSGFATVGVGFGVAFAFAFDTGFGMGLATDLARSLGGGEVGVACVESEEVGLSPFLRPLAQ